MNKKTGKIRLSSDKREYIHLQSDSLQKDLKYNKPGSKSLSVNSQNYLQAKIHILSQINTLIDNTYKVCHNEETVKQPLKVSGL